MKIKFENELLIIYLYKYHLKLDDLNNLKDNIKKILINLIKYYKISLNGVYDVVIYENKKYGYILEIDKIKNFDYSEYIDLKLDIKHNASFYLMFDSYNCIEELSNVFYKNNSFFVNIDNVINVNKIIEFANIIYKNTANYLEESVKIK